MPDSARQNAQPGAPAPLEEFENGLLEKKQKREHGGSVSVCGASCCLFVFWYISCVINGGWGGTRKKSLKQAKSSTEKKAVGIFFHP